MRSTVPYTDPPVHRVRPELSYSAMPDDLPADSPAGLPLEERWSPAIGRALNKARRRLDWDTKELAGAIDRDPRQVRRWLKGTERLQLDTLWSAESLRQPFVLALAELAGLEIEMTLKMRMAA